MKTVKATVIHFEATGIITHAQEKKKVTTKKGSIYYRMVDIKLPKPVMKYSMVILLDENVLLTGHVYHDGNCSWQAQSENQITNVKSVGETLMLPQRITNISTPNTEGIFVENGGNSIPQSVILQYKP